MSKTVLDVGNCSPDHASIAAMIANNFDAQVTQVHDGDEALNAVRSTHFDLIMVNRLMDRSGASGLEIIERIKALPDMASTPVMMITNFDDHQQLAQEAGAVPGFGKQALNLPKTIATLGQYLA